MAERVKVFVSHSHKDNEFTGKLVNDLKAAGADVWVDFNSISHDDFVQGINEGLTDRQWLVLVMTPDSLHSSWVPLEVNAALNRCRQRKMHGVIPVLAKPCDEEDIPPLWDVLHRYDATQDYDQAIMSLISTLGLNNPRANTPESPITKEEEDWFASLMRYPSLERLRSLETREFQRFCSYMFAQAGYSVTISTHDQNHELYLSLSRSSGTALLPVSHVLIKGNATAKVAGYEIRAIRGAFSSSLELPYYIVTRSTFEPRAHSEIAATPQLHLFDGMHLIRYITYLTAVRDTLAQSGDKLVGPISPNILFVADRVRRRSSRQTKVLALAHNKGGIGSTTTAFNLALELAQRGQTTLLVDMDGQGSLSEMMLSQQISSARHFNIVDYFNGLCSLKDLVIPTLNERIWLIPADKNLMLNERRWFVPVEGSPALSPGQSSPDTELQFTTELHDDGLRPLGYPVEAFDWIILDTSPALSLYVHSAMVAAHYVLALTSDSVHSGAALKNVLATLRLTSALTGLQSQRSACLFTQWRDTTMSYELALSLAEILPPYGMQILKTKIPFDINISHCTLKSGIQRGEYQPLKTYGALVDEILTHIKNE